MSSCLIVSLTQSNNDRGNEMEYFKLKALQPSDQSEVTHEVTTRHGNTICFVFSKEDGEEMVAQLNATVNEYETV